MLFSCVKIAQKTSAELQKLTNVGTTEEATSLGRRGRWRRTFKLACSWCARLAHAVGAMHSGGDMDDVLCTDGLIRRSEQWISTWMEKEREKGERGWIVDVKRFKRSKAKERIRVR